MSSQRKANRRRHASLSRAGRSRLSLNSRSLHFEPLEDRRMLAVIAVDSLLDNFNPGAPTTDGVVTLREAILAANTDLAVGDAPAGSGMDEIEFAVDGTIDLASQLPTITADLSIDADGRRITIAGAGGINGGAYRLFSIDDGNAGNQITVSLSGLSLTGGNVSGNGGAILNAEDLTVTGSTIWDNFGLAGGGISNSGTLQLENVTISNNKSAFSGGGISNSGTAELVSVAVYRNGGNMSFGGGIATSGMSSVFTIHNSIVANNIGSGATLSVFGSFAAGSSFNFFDRPDSAGGLMHGVDGNILGNGSGGFLNAMLGELDDNGGPVPTHSPLGGSPVLNNGDDTSTATSDMRGAPFLRNDGNGVDIGPVERQTLVGLSLVVDEASDAFDGNYSTNHLSLREAISLANGSVGAEVITFGTLFDTAQTIAVASQFLVRDDLTISGTGKLVTLDAGGGVSGSSGDGHRIFLIDDRMSANILEVTLSGLTLTGGDPASNNLNGHGGAIYSREGLTLLESTVTGNTAVDGGGVYNLGELIVAGSTFSENFASDQGGGVTTFTQATIDKSTFSGNDAGNEGGGVYNMTGTTTVTSSTFTENDAVNSGGGIRNSAGTFHLNSSIVAGNTANSGANVSGALNTDTFNYTTGDPLLGPLSDNGGPTKTHAPMFTSPALNAGDPAITVGNDQRGTGFERVELGRADIGALEFEAANLPVAILVSNIGDTIDNDLSAGQLTLREVVRIANLRPGVDTIEFDPTLFATSQIILTGSQLDITDSLIINGPGQELLTINGALGGDGIMNGNGHTLLRILGEIGSSLDVEITDLRLTGGDPNGNGGAILSQADLTLSRVIVENNAGTNAGGVFGLSDRTITVEDSLFTGNRARSMVLDSAKAGAIFGGNINIHRSTFSGNMSFLGSGAVRTSGSGVVLNVSDSTFYNNQGTLEAGAVLIRLGASANVVNSTFSGSADSVGAIVMSGNTLNLSHSTFADNPTDDLRVTSGTANVTHSIVPVVNGTLATNTFNLIGVDAMLGPLADNGGPTFTHALLPGSPAIDAGDIGIVDPPAFDQRGNPFLRIVDGDVPTDVVIDIGAYEVQVVPSADFDSDGDVDGRDFLAWQRGFGKPGAVKSDGDADNDTDVDGDDLVVWQGQYGTGQLLAFSGQQLAREDDSSHGLSPEYRGEELLADSPSREYPTPTTAGKLRVGRLSSAELIDLAMAVEWMGRTEIDGQDFFLVEQTGDAAARDLVFAAAYEVGRPVRAVEFFAAKPQAAEENGGEEAWLSEEVLERVFG